MRLALPAALLLAVLALVSGCGSGSSSSTISKAEAKAAVKASAKIAEEGEAAAPKGASPTVRGFYRAFPAPNTGTMQPVEAKAVKAGEAACRGKSPVAVKTEFYAAAAKYLEPQQAKMIAKIKSFEAGEKTDQAFVAGQLAADTYAATLPSATEAAGYQGCVYALAQAVEHKLEPKKKQKK